MTFDEYTFQLNLITLQRAQPPGTVSKDYGLVHTLNTIYGNLSSICMTPAKSNHRRRVGGKNYNTVSNLINSYKKYFYLIFHCRPIIITSVTRLGHFLKVLVTNFLTK